MATSVTPSLAPASSRPSLKRSRSPEADSHQEEADLKSQLEELMSRGTAKSRLLARSYARTAPPYHPVCPRTTIDDCIKHQRRALRQEASSEDAASEQASPCDKVHLRPLVRPWTDLSLGYCSYLNTCYGEPSFANSPSLTGGPTPSGRKTQECRYTHFEIVPPPQPLDPLPASSSLTHPVSSFEPSPKHYPQPSGPLKPVVRGLKDVVLGEEEEVPAYPASWISCDVRKFDLEVLGKFDVIMADPPWDIHMSLPYGTMTDEEMRLLPIPFLSAPTSLLFLWVTARAIELGRDLVARWGFKRVDEIVWAKTNQVGKLIRTGRTGHWLNHTSEHLLVGFRSPPTATHPLPNSDFPPWLQRGLDTDTLVSEVRETSRKPDEVYSLIERCCRGGRKVEVFGRKHNTRRGWLTIGNQIGGDCVHEPELASRLKERYPDRKNLADLPAIS